MFYLEAILKLLRGKGVIYWKVPVKKKS